MKNAVIICEFNPLHNGHRRLLSRAREAGAENVICVMSGNAVQRGELACLDKYSRARHAVLAGADAVVELPAEYTLSAARQFALGGVKIANLVKDATLFFGSECGDVKALEDVAALSTDKEVNERIKAALSRGVGYPAAFAEATGSHIIENSPNNTLGIEYIKAIIDTGRKISYMTTKRDPSVSSDAPKGCVSSSEIRSSMLSDKEKAADFVPSFVASDLKNASPSSDAYYAVLRYALTSGDLPDNVYDDGEGLLNRLVGSAEKASTFDEFCDLACTKRYTRARVKRLALNAVIRNTFSHAELTGKPVKFVNLLAADADNRDVLSLIDAPVAVSVRTREKFAEYNLVTARLDALFSAVRYPFDDKAVFVKR